jgi:hypothetical protein
MRNVDGTGIIQQKRMAGATSAASEGLDDRSSNATIIVSKHCLKAREL